MTIKYNRYSLSCCLCSILYICINIISNILGRIGVIGVLRTCILFILCYGMLVVVFLLKPNHFPFDIVLVLIVVTVLFYFSNLLHPEINNVAIKSLWGSVITLYNGLLAYLFVRILRNKKEIKCALIVSAIVFFVFYSIEGIQSVIRGYWEEIGSDGLFHNQPYSMSFGYNILFPTIVFLYYGLKEKRKLLLILGIIGFFETLIGGSRAAPISVVFFLLMYWFLFNFSSAPVKRKVLLIFSFLVVFLVLIVFYRDIIIFISNLFSYLGISSRNITKVLDSSLINDLNRNILYEKTINLILNGGILGNGIYSDRYYLGNYCHNILLEVFLDFGWLGGFICIALLAYMIISIIKSKDNNWKGVFLVLFSCWAIRLMVSYSFWLDSRFWMTIAVFMCYKTDVVNKPNEVICNEI